MSTPAGRSRLLVITPDYPPDYGGIPILVSRLVQNFDRFDPTVVAFARQGDTEFDRSTGVAASRVPVSRIPKVPNLALNARGIREALALKPRVILAAHIIAGPAARTIRRLTGTPYVLYLHADELWRARLLGGGVRHAAASIAVSRYTRRIALDAGGDPERVLRIPPGVDIPDGSRAVRADRPTIVTLARLTDRYKGHDVMMRALPLIRRAVPDVIWVIVGQGPLRAELEESAASEGVRDSVIFTGALPDEERDAWLDRAHVFAMPSRLPPRGFGGEGFGIVYLEAGAHGLPVVAGNVAGALDAVDDGVTGVLVEPTDPAAVAAAISDLLLDRRRAERLGSSGRTRAREMTWPKTAARVEEVLVRVARREPVLGLNTA
ncbi:MAG: glycosyltransferase family 4 protein [Solirubrobacterales bacterium]